MNLRKVVWEGWTVQNFIDELQPALDMIMSGNSWKKPFKSKKELSDWCRDNVNCDGSISIADAVLLQKYLLAAYSLNKQQWLNADMDHDGCVDIFDMVFMRRELIKRMGVE